MKNLAIASYSLTGSAYLLFVLWLVFQRKVKEASQGYFVSWLLILSVLGINGTLFTSSNDVGLVYVLYRVHFALLIGSGVALFLFATSLRRELTEWDITYTLPALAVMPLIWTVVTKGVREVSYGWSMVYNGYWFSIFIVALYGYYVGTIFQLYKVLSVLRKTGSKTAVRRVQILLGSVIFLTLAGLLTPIGNVLNLHFMPVLIGALYVFPAGLMAYSFRLTE